MKKVLLYLILIMAVGMAGTVAYVSVNGLLKVFAGAGTVGLILFSSIEAAKIIATSAIHTYGKKIGWFYNGILSLFIVIAMAITSMGIYGFLSSSYKETFSKFENLEAQIELLEKKRDGYQLQLENVNKEKGGINETINELSKGLSNNVIEYKDKETGEIIRTTSSATRKVLEGQLNKAIERQESLNTKSDGLSDKIFELENEITEVKLGDDVAAELGPLKYLADVSGMTMDEVMKYFIILLIVIGDPMAVIMVIVFNKVVNHGKDDAVSDAVSDAVNEVVNETVKTTPEFIRELDPGFPDAKMELVNEESGEIELPEEQLPIEDEVHIASPEYDETPDNDVDVEIEYQDEIIEPEINKESNSGKKIYVASIEKGVQEIKKTDEKVDIAKESVKKPITREDIKEIKERERGFSVTVPVRKKTSIERIGSNKEVRDGKSDTVFFKKR